MIRKLRADAAAQKFADDCGRFQQIFPPGERPQLDKYMKLLETACSLYKLSFDAEQKQEIQRFLVQKVRKILFKSYYEFSNQCRNERDNACYAATNADVLCVGKRRT